jgi:hypothetical protein
MTVFGDLENEAKYIIDRRGDLAKLTKQHRDRIMKMLYDQSLTPPDIDKLVYILSLTDKQDA